MDTGNVRQKSKSFIYGDYEFVLDTELLLNNLVDWDYRLYEQDFLINRTLSFPVNQIYTLNKLSLNTDYHTSG